MRLPVAGAPGQAAGWKDNGKGDLMVEPNVRDNPELSRFEILQDGTVAAFVTYEDRDGFRVFHYTETHEANRSKGLATSLIRQSLDATRDADLHVIPQCPFVGAFLQSHREYESLIPVERRNEFELPE